MAGDPTLYDLLGVSRNAPPAIIKAAYRTHSKLSHPDTGNPSGDNFSEITNAYTILSDPGQRKKYDETLDAEPEVADPVDPDAYRDTWGTEDTWTPEYEYTPADFSQEDPRKLAGFDAWKNIGLTPDKLSWMPDARQSAAGYQPLPGVPEKAGRGNYRRNAWIAAALWLVAVFAYGAAVGAANAGVFGFGAFVGAAIFGLPYALGAKGALLKKLTLGYYGFAIFAMLGSIMLSLVGSYRIDGEPSTGTVVFWIVATTALLCVTYGFAVHFTHRARTGPPSPRQTMAESQMIDPEAAETYRQWGTPGRALHGGNTPFSERNAALGFGGEVLTSQLLDAFMEIPGVRIVHGITIPGFGDADFDHVVLCGDLLVVVDSKNWSGGSYYWLSGQITATTPEGLQTRGNPMGWGLPTFQQMFADKQVIPAVVIHAHDGGAVATNNVNRGAEPLLMTPLEFVEQIGRLCVDQRAATVDRAALTRLIQMMAK